MEYKIKSDNSLYSSFSELWKYRELFYFFTWRDIKVKYKQSVLGFGWAILQPFLMMVVFTIIGNRFSIDSENIPYPIYFYSALLMWYLFANGFSSAAQSMVSNSGIIKKIYFPRLIIPFSSILVALFDFIMAFFLLFGLMIYYEYEPTWSNLPFIFIAVIQGVLSTLGIALLIAALNVKYRDFRYIIGFMLQLMFFVSPVILPVTEDMNEWLKIILSINPASGAINMFRYSVLGIQLNWYLWGIGIVSNLLVLLLGGYYFRKTEAYFADIA